MNMNAINLRPALNPDAPEPPTHAEAPAEQDAPGTSFENLLDEKNVPSDGKATGQNKAPQPDETAESAGDLKLPDAADFSALFAMLPVLPPPSALPLAPQPAAHGTLTASESPTIVPVPVMPAVSAAPNALPGATMGDLPPTPAFGLPSAPALPLKPLLPQEALPPQEAVFPPEPTRPLRSEPVVEAMHTPTSGLLTPSAPASGSGESAPRRSAIPPFPPAATLFQESFAQAVSMPEPSLATGETAATATLLQAALPMRGTSGAKQGRTMPDTPTPPASEPEKATSAAAFEPAQPVLVPLASASNLHATVPPSWQQYPAGEQREERPAFFAQANEAPASTPAFPGSFVAPAPRADEPAANVSTPAETIVHRTLEAAERLRVTGGERLELRIKLETGQELTVRLQLAHGEVRPVFLTASPELRQALEQNWAHFSARADERQVRVTTPVFESPNAQSGMNDSTPQQREGRQHAFAEAQEAAAAAHAPIRRVLPRATPASAPAAAAAPGVQLYA